MNRRGFLQSILAAGVAPYVSTAAGVLMPIRQIIQAPMLTEAAIREALREMEKFYTQPTHLFINPRLAHGWTHAFGAEYGSLKPEWWS